MNLNLWAQDHALSIVVFGITLFLIIQFFVERGHGIRLSKRYRNRIFEAQSKIFLNATQHLISGNKDLAIKEFLSAVDLNRETIETYFALGGLFRSNGEIEKAISIHRSLIARENISESTRLKALRELAMDFDRGGFVDKAIETYKDALKINRDQYEVIQALCRIYEDIGEWDKAYQYRTMLSKVGQENQAETISHILVQKAKEDFKKGDFASCDEELQDAFRFAPTISAKMLKLRLFMAHGEFEDAKSLFIELIQQHPMYCSFVFEEINTPFNNNEAPYVQGHIKTAEALTDFFLELDSPEVFNSPAVVLAKARIFNEKGEPSKALETLEGWVSKGHKRKSEALQMEYLKLLIKLGKSDQVMKEAETLLNQMGQSVARYYCQECGFNSDSIFWRCPQCNEWETIQFRWKV